MSKIRLHGSSSGYTEIAPVAASGNNTLTLPDDGTIISKDSNGAVGVTSITVGTGVTIGDGRVTCSTLHGSAANCTQIPAANIVGLCTAGFERSGGFGGGKILQVVESTSSTTVSTSGNSEETLLTLSITPASSSNKVLIFMQFLIQATANTNSKAYIRVYRGTSSGTLILTAKDGGEDADTVNLTMAGQKLDSPSTSSAQTYTATLARLSGGTNVCSTDGNPYYLQAMEVEG